MTAVHQASQTLDHPTPTSAIGLVLDSRLNVLGVDGLRVVDASVMRSIVQGNVSAPVIASAPVIMIVDQAADLIAHDTAALALAAPIA